MNLLCDRISTLHTVPHHLTSLTGCPDMRHSQCKKQFEIHHSQLQSCKNSQELIEVCKRVIAGQHGESKFIFHEINDKYIDELVPKFKNFQFTNSSGKKTAKLPNFERYIYQEYEKKSPGKVHLRADYDANSKVFEYTVEPVMEVTNNEDTPEVEEAVLDAIELENVLPENLDGPNDGESDGETFDAKDEDYNDPDFVI